jgi:trk system potassium uptake protein TrkA
MKPDGLVLIVSCGQLGRTLATALSQDGNKVVIVDINKGPLEELGRDFRGSRLEGDGADLAVLRKADIAKAAAVIAVTHHDAINLMVTQAAKTLFQVPRVMARVNDPQRDAIFRELGIETVCPASITAEMFSKALEGSDPSSISPP